MPREDATVDHYATLEILTTATHDEIKKQFRKLALKYHPDRNPGREAEFNAKFQQIQAAHELLTDPVRRKIYDRSRLYHNGIHRSKPQPQPQPPPPHPSTHAPAPPNEPTARKYGNAGATRSGFASGSRPGDGPFSSKNQWDHTSRAYSQAGPTAWKATQNQFPHRTNREVPRTPKKTKDKPYVDPDVESFAPREHRTNKEDLPAEHTPLRNSFFAGRDPREKEWMDSSASDTKSAADSNPRSSGVWEHKSSSEEDLPRKPTFYAYTPRTRLRTNPRDKSPEKPPPHSNGQYGTTNRTTNSAAAEPPVSPLRSNFFTRSQTMREPAQPFDQGTPSQQGHDRRRSNSSTGIDGTERRRFSYLFNEDGTRRPHRSSKQASADSDQDVDDNTMPKSRTASLRQSYPSSRRNTLERDGVASKLSSDQRQNSNLSSSDRSRSTPYSHSTFDEPSTPLSSFKSFEAKKPSPVRESTDARHHSKSFSADDWNSVFSGGQNIFAVPARKGQQSPRKGPAVPKIQTTFNAAVPPNFSRPRPTSTSAEPSGAPQNATPDQAPSDLEISDSQPSDVTNNVPETFPKNAFQFKDWENAFAETNPFDLNPSQPNGSSSSIRSSSRHRKVGLKKTATQYAPQSKAPRTENDGDQASPPYSSKRTETRPATDNTSTTSNSSRLSPSTVTDGSGTAVPNMPSPIAMDIDTPSGSPSFKPNAPITPVDRKPSSLRQFKAYHSPAVSDEDPVSPIKGDVPPISPLRSDEVPHNIPEPVSKKSSTPPNIRGTSTSPTKAHGGLDMDSLRNVEPMSYPKSNGLDGHWRNFEESLPFESQPAPFVNISPPPPIKKAKASMPQPPQPPSYPTDPSPASYDKYCAAMTVYQAHWNEYNAKVVNHIRARLEADVLKCAQNKGFASGTSTDHKSGAQVDLIETRKALDELEEDRHIRANWEIAIKGHTNILIQWRLYLERLEATNDL